MKQKFAIFDRQLNSLREEEYDSEDEAIKSFAKYMKDIREDKMIETFIFFGEISGDATEEEKHQKYIDWCKQAYKDDKSFLESLDSKLYQNLHKVQRVGFHSLM